MKRKLCTILTAAFLALVGVGVFAACGSKPKDLAEAEITLSQNTFVYTGEQHCPEVTVTLGSKKLNNGDLAIIYADNVNVGTATVTVTGAPQSSYTGSKSATFTITQAESTMPREAHLEGTYNQTINDVIKGTAYSNIAPGETLTGDTLLTEIGEDQYSFKVIYTPADTNYAPFECTVYITVNKAKPPALEDLETEGLTAALGAKYSSVKLPLGIEVEEGKEDEIFTQAGRAALPVVAKQVVEGRVDDEHYEVLHTQVPVEVAMGEYELNEGHVFEYENTNFSAGEGGTYVVNGDIVLNGQFDMYKNWEFSMTFSYDDLESLVIDAGANKSNATLKGTTQKNAQFYFKDGKAKSWMGGLISRYDEAPEGQDKLTGDDVWLPEAYKTWGSVKITIISTMSTKGSDITTRYFEIYIGDGATDGNGTLLFKRSSGVSYPRTLQLDFKGAKNVKITATSLTETAYSNDKLTGTGTSEGTKLKQFVSEGTTIKDEYKQGGILMIGDSLVDFWATGASGTAIAGSQKIFTKLGYEGKVINLGMGSATAESWLNYLESCEVYFEQFNPEVVYMLIGCNQITDEHSDSIAEYVIKLIEKVRALYSDTQIIVNSMMPTTKDHSRWASWSVLEGANVQIKAYIEEKGGEKTHYLDLERLFTPDPSQPVSETNAPDPKYYSDGLHYTAATYDILTGKVMDLLVELDLATKTTVTLTVENLDGEEDLTEFVKWEYTAYNGHLVMKIELTDKYFQIEDILYNGTSIKAEHYADGTLTYDLEETDSHAITVKLKAVDDPDDNTKDDGDFTVPQG